MASPSLDERKNSNNDVEKLPPPSTEAPYSVFTNSEKWFIVCAASTAGFFSPFTANIYISVIPTLAREFGQSIQKINLTITMYMIIQGLSPMLFGTLSDSLGRRLVLSFCLGVLALACVGLALMPTSAYWLLMILRILQAAGSASTIAIGSGVVGDVTERHERGKYFAIMTALPLIAPAISPVLGGVLAQQLGWRSIFWFVCICSATVSLCLFLFLPETLRKLVGDGSSPPSRLFMPIIPLLGRGRIHVQSSPEKRSWNPFSGFKNPLPIFLNLDIDIVLLFNAIIYAEFYGVTASLSVLFEDVYPFLNEATVGLCFLSIGGGMAVGTISTAKFTDWNYQRLKKKQLDQGLGIGDDEFPIEKARLEMMPPLTILYAAVCIAYGYCLEYRVHIAGPLILQFAVGFVGVTVMNGTSMLLVDLIPKQSSSVTACNNVVRCGFGALYVATIDLTIGVLGPGKTFVLYSMFSIAFLPGIFIVMKIGRVWRARRAKAAKGVQD